MNIYPIIVGAKGFDFVPRIASLKERSAHNVLGNFVLGY